jgi:periplasmic protein TonB
MNTSITSYQTMDDLVFENRNHSYGAYFLRKKYDKHLSIALGLSLSAITIALVSPQLLKGEEVAEITKKDGPTVVMTQPPPITPPPPMEQFLLPPPPPPPAVANIFHANLVNDPVDEVDIPTNEQMNRPTFNSDLTGNNTSYVAPDVDFGTSAPEIGVPEKTNEPFVWVEKMPEFDGDMKKFLERNLHYPEAAILQDIEGRVYLSFIVGKDGAIADIQVLRGISKECDEEAVRVVSKMPKWRPGKQSGTPVPVRFQLPIVFKMNH